MKQPVQATLYVGWTTTFSALSDTLHRYGATIVCAPTMGNEWNQITSPKGMPVRIAFEEPSGWQQFCTERGRNHPAAIVLTR